MPEQQAVGAEDLALLVGRLPGVVVRYAPLGDRGIRFVYLASPAQELFGLDPEECMADPSTLLRHIHGHDLEVWAEARRESLATGEPLQFVFRYSRWGETRWISASCAAAVREGELVYWDGIFSDVTAFKTTEVKLTRSQILLSAAQELAQLGGWDFELATGKITWTPETFAIHGLDPALGEPDFERLAKLYHPEDFPTLGASVHRAMTTGEAYRHDLRVVRPATGEVRHVAASGGVIRNTMTGKVERLFGTLLDITDHKTLEGTLKAARNAAEAAAEAKANFLATMSHEIRTPLNGIAGMTALLSATALDEAQREYCETIRSSGEVLLTVVNDILDFSRIEAGKLPIERIPFDLGRVLTSVLAIVGPQAGEKGLALSMSQPPEALPVLVGDPTRLRQILLNLVGNAIKFTEAGKVLLAVTGGPAEEGYAIRITVTDTGIGLPEVALPRLFERFSQADSSTTRRFGGTGLGLAICRSLVELMGGTIGVQSRLGEGSQFWLQLTLPIADVTALDVRALDVTALDGTALDGTALAKRPTASGQACRILLAEDNVVNQRLATLILEQAGHQVERAGNGLEAVALASEGRFDLILMDGHMPEMNGYQAAKAIRAASGRQVPIIALTASALPEDRRRCTEAGMDDFLPKPYLPHELLAIVERWGAPAEAVV